jgi:hypothetical protein
MDHVQQQSGDFFQHTFIPEHKTLSKMYGKTGKQSLWNTMPILPVENLHGVSCVSPIHILSILLRMVSQLTRLFLTGTVRGKQSVILLDMLMSVQRQPNGTKRLPVLAAHRRPLCCGGAIGSIGLVPVGQRTIMVP